MWGKGRMALPLSMASSGELMALGLEGEELVVRGRGGCGWIFP